MNATDSIINTQPKPSVRSVRGFQHALHLLESLEYRVRVLDLIRVFLEVRSNRSDDLESVGGHEPTAASGSRRVELHIVRKCVRLRLAERDELTETREVHLVGDGVEGVAVFGKRSAIDVSGLDAVELPLENDDVS